MPAASVTGLGADTAMLPILGWLHRPAHIRHGAAVQATGTARMLAQSARCTCSSPAR
jgi:hypothetical protein